MFTKFVAICFYSYHIKCFDKPQTKLELLYGDRATEKGVSAMLEDLDVAVVVPSKKVCI